MELLDGPALKLNNNKTICRNYFTFIQTIKYPEKYQQQYEDYLSLKSAKMSALDYFNESLPETKRITTFQRLSSRLYVIAMILTAIMALGAAFMVDSTVFFLRLVTLTAGTLIFAFLSKKVATYSEYDRSNKCDYWEELNPEPVLPQLKEFCDPEASLTKKDLKTLEVFEYWPGYPPFWGVIRDAALKRDLNRCQVTGCPSRTELHIHHCTPISGGGSHRLDNLVTLCAYHHGLQPEPGHARIKASVHNKYFSIVSGHMRSGSMVRSHLRRKSLCTESDLVKIFTWYKFKCSRCGNSDILLGIDFVERKIIVTCRKCYAEWTYIRKLAEENGPQIAQDLIAGNNKGSWNAAAFCLRDGN